MPLAEPTHLQLLSDQKICPSVHARWEAHVPTMCSLHIFNILDFMLSFFLFLLEALIDLFSKAWLHNALHLTKTWMKWDNFLK